MAEARVSRVTLIPQTNLLHHHISPYCLHCIWACTRHHVQIHSVSRSGHVGYLLTQLLQLSLHEFYNSQSFS